MTWQVGRFMWRLGRRVNRFLDQWLGEPATDTEPERPGVMKRLTVIETKVDEHLEWHANPGGRPAKTTVPRPNGPAPGRR